MPEKKAVNEDLLYKGSSANLPRLHTFENKTPLWDFKEFAVTQYLKQGNCRVEQGEGCDWGLLKADLLGQTHHKVHRQ